MTVELVWRETCGARDESPSSNLGRVKQEEAIRADVMRSKSRRENGLTDLLERKDRRRAEADDAEQSLTPNSDHGVRWKHREGQAQRTCVHCHHERRQVDAHLQTSVASPTSVVEAERGAVTQRRSMSA